MALHPSFPRSPYAPLDPAHRWFPADETLRTTAYEKLLQWCTDAIEGAAGEGGPTYRFLYVDQAGFEKHNPRTVADLAASFTEYQG